MTDSDLLLYLAGCTLKEANGNELPGEKEGEFWKAMNMLISAKKKFWFLRGESDENLRRHYLVDSTNPTFLAEVIFNIGTKGRLCLTDTENLIFNDTSITNFRTICNLIYDAFRSGSKGCSPRSTVIRNAISNNQQFVSNFSNINKLVSKYSMLSKISKVRVNIYYLAILHTINPRAYYNISGFVSTTESRNIAANFSNNIMIIGWIPKRTKLMSVAARCTDEYRNICRQFGLPSLDTPIYPEQEEISILCGILPHFMVGISIHNNFYINPALFETLYMSEECITINQRRKFWSDVTNNGLWVDQSKFFEYCKLSNYKKYFTFDGNQYKSYKLN